MRKYEHLKDDVLTGKLTKGAGSSHRPSFVTKKPAQPSSFVAVSQSLTTARKSAHNVGSRGRHIGV